MVFGGFQKLTLLDYPGKMACILFTKGCNFRCPFCHNSFLVDRTDEAESISAEEVLAYLKKRQGILEGVCITGGEPLLHGDLEDFIKDVRALGYSVKLDTNGSLPHKLKDLVQKGLIDYVAMDIKNSMEKYNTTIGCENIDLSKVEESIDFLLSGKVDYEFRTTVVDELHTPEDIEKISRRISGAKKYFLQNFVDSGYVIENGLHPVSDDTINCMKKIAENGINFVEIRGKA